MKAVCWLAERERALSQASPKFYHPERRGGFVRCSCSRGVVHLATLAANWSDQLPAHEFGIYGDFCLVAAFGSERSTAYIGYILATLLARLGLSSAPHSPARCKLHEHARKILRRALPRVKPGPERLRDVRGIGFDPPPIWWQQCGSFPT